MTDAALTPERILDAAEDVLRRYGPAKTTVVDVARALGVSHGSVYRHFASKAALRDAVVSRWLARIVVPLTAIVAEDGPAPDRLRRWLETLREQKRRKVLDDPEMFATYHALAAEAGDAVRAHLAHLVADVAAIIADGVARGELAAADPHATAIGVQYATARFHHPAHAASWNDPGEQTAFDAVWSLLLAALRPR